jgi:[protein]-arginine 3-hydroxylase / protease
MAKMMGTQLQHKSGEETLDLIEVMIGLLTHQLQINKEADQPAKKKLKLDCSPPRTCDIDIANEPALDVFWNTYYAPRIPALLTNTINHWPALTKWPDMNYLVAVAGQRTVPIELGQHYTHENWSQKLVKFEDFIQDYILAEDTQTIGYLAQHELFDQIPELKNDICIPEYCCRGAPPRLKAWLGPKGTVSPLHTDPTHNLLAQVFGAKLVILVEPAATVNLYAHDHFVLNNTSQVDANAPDFEQHPLAKLVRFKRVILKAGDVLYIPPGWWHYVRSLSPSFSVSFWFD